MLKQLLDLPVRQAMHRRYFALLTRVVVAVLGSFVVLAVALLSLGGRQAVRAAPPARPSANGAGVVSVTHTANTTHEMRVFGNGRISDQFLVKLDGITKVNQIRDTLISHTTIAIMFDPHDKVDVGAYGDYEMTTPIALYAPSEIAGYSEDTYAVYASQLLPYQVTQMTFATHTNNAVIMELLIRNTADITLTGGKLLYMIDMDVGRFDYSDSGGYTDSRRMVYQTDYHPSDQKGYAMGIALLEGELRGYGVVDSYKYSYPNSRIEISKTLLYPTNPISFTKNDLNSNLLSWLVVNIPTILPNEEAKLTLGLYAETGTGIDEDGAENAALDNLLISYDNTISPTPKLTVTKFADPADVVQAGERLHYTIVITNIGQGSATGVVVSDTVPNYTQFVPDSIILDVPAGSGLVGTEPPIIVNNLTIPPGQSATVSYMVVVTDEIPSGGVTIINTVVVTDISGLRVTDSVSIVVESLALTKTSDITTAKPGNLITYHLRVNNAGDQEATGIKLTDFILPGASYDTSDSTGTYFPGENIVKWSFNLSRTGIINKWVRVKVDDPFLACEEAITNIATIISDNSDLFTKTHIINVNTAPDLTLVTTNELTQVLTDETITYAITVSNTDNQHTKDVVVVDKLSEFMTFIDASTGWEEAGGVITWTIERLDVGQSETLTVTAKVTNAFPAGVETVTSIAKIVGYCVNSGNPHTTNIQVSDTDTVIAAPDLSITKTSEATKVRRNDIITYILTISNDNIKGTQGTTGIIVTDTLSPHTTFVSASHGGTETITGQVTWPPFDLAVGEIRTRVLTVTVNEDLTPGLLAIMNTAIVTDYSVNGLDTNSNNNYTLHQDDLALEPYLVITKSDRLESVDPGEMIVYTITITNEGNRKAEDIFLEDILPDPVDFQDASDGGYKVPGSSKVEWPHFDLLVGDSEPRLLTVTVRRPFPTSTLILRNEAAVEYNDGSTPIRKAVTDSTEVMATPVLSISKNGPAIAEQGELITYTLTVTNNHTSNAIAGDLVITDVLPKGAYFVEAFGGNKSFDSELVTWRLDELGVGEDEAATVGFVVTATSTIINDDYGVKAKRGFSATGTISVTTIISSQVYLPVIFKDFIAAPDLIVKDLIGLEDEVTVTIENVGNLPVLADNGFWVDVYINPETCPTQVNQSWQQLAGENGQGIVWRVEAFIHPGNTLTLHNDEDDDYYREDLSEFSTLALDAQIYAQVDSFYDGDAYSPHAKILEIHEITGEPYNNIFGSCPPGLRMTPPLPGETIPITRD